MRAQASSRASTAQVCPRRAASASSTETLPVPAPTSQTVSSGPGASFARMTARSSCFVMGTSPRQKASSGMPPGRSQGRGAASTSRTDSGAKSAPAHASTVCVTRRSSGQPSFSPTTACSAPRPASRISRQREAGVCPPPVRKKAGFPVISAAMGSQGLPWAEQSTQSCQGFPRRAESSWTLERPGRTRQAMPASRSSPSRPSAPE